MVIRLRPTPSVCSKLKIIVTGSFKSQLIDYFRVPGRYGDKVEGSIWQFMIISSTLLKSDWSKFSIWNGVMGANQ